jgi:hypothetical protein
MGYKRDPSDACNVRHKREAYETVRLWTSLEIVGESPSESAWLELKLFNSEEKRFEKRGGYDSEIYITATQWYQDALAASMQYTQLLKKVVNEDPHQHPTWARGSAVARLIGPQSGRTRSLR